MSTIWGTVSVDRGTPTCCTLRNKNGTDREDATSGVPGASEGNHCMSPKTSAVEVYSPPTYILYPISCGFAHMLVY
jgi:hypothetical protein